VRWRIGAVVKHTGMGCGGGARRPVLHPRREVLLVRPQEMAEARCERPDAIIAEGSFRGVGAKRSSSRLRLYRHHAT